MFKKFECGCVGFVITGQSKPSLSSCPYTTIYRLIDCRQSGDFFEDGIDIREATRSLEEKASEDLPPAEIEELLKSLARLVSDGHDLKRLSLLLNSVLQERP